MDESTKIKNLVKNANKFEDMQFRLLLEDLIKQGGREAEQVTSELALSDSIMENVRINLIRSMGYVTSTIFLITLQKILESDDGLRLRKAAIISISKFNDKRALNMLNNALKRINNPILQDSISTEISRIKKDNPILSLMPKFLNGVNDPKTFRTTLEILKQILNPSDAQVFIYHLNSETPFVGDGAFEVLCWRGDESVKFSIFDFFRKKLKLIDCSAEGQCYSLQDLLGKMEKFVTRNSDTINFILKELKDIYKVTKDPAVKDILVNIFSSSHKREVLSSLEDIYNNEPERREIVIQKLCGNEEATFILIYKFKNDPENKENILNGLLTTQSGANFIIENFDSFDDRYKKFALDHIDDSNYRFFKPLIERFLYSKDFGEKKFALDIIRKNQDSRYQSILFSLEHENDFIRMQQDYVDTIASIFFVQAFKFFVNRVPNHELAPTLMRRYFSQKNAFINAEPILTFDESYDLINFAEKLVKQNNRDLILDVLEIFYSIRTFDYRTYSKILDCLEKIKELRGSRITNEEKGMLNKVKANMLNISGDLKLIDNGNTNISHFIDKAFPDYDLLEYIIKSHYLSFFVNRQKIFERIRRVFKLTNDIDAFDAVKYFLRRPDFTPYFKEEITQCTKSTNYLLKDDADKLIANLPNPLRIVLRFEGDRRVFYSGLENQFNEVFPEVEVTRNVEILPTDILVADTKSIEALASENRLGTKKLFVLLKDRDEFVSIRDLNPKVFPQPLSFYKIVKAILPEFFPVGDKTSSVST